MIFLEAIAAMAESAWKIRVRYGSSPSLVVDTLNGSSLVKELIILVRAKFGIPEGKEIDCEYT